MRALFIKGLLHLLALLSLRTLHRFATLLGGIIARQSHLSLTQVTRTNIRLCFPQLSPTAQNTMIKQSIIETCKAFVELGELWLWPSQRVLGLVRKVSGEACLQQALQRGKGVILLTPHLGAWELAGLYTLSHYRLTALYRPPKLMGLDHFIHLARRRAGGCLVATDQSGIRALYQTLRRGQVVGILPDQVPGKAGSGVFAPFLGVSAYTMILVHRLVRKTGAEIIFTYAERLPQGKGFHLHFLPAPANSVTNDVELACTALNQGIEQCLETCPTQYQWSYKRFKRRPEGEPSVY